MLARVVDWSDVVVRLELLSVRVRHDLEAFYVMRLHANQLRRTTFHAADGRVQSFLYVHCASDIKSATSTRGPAAASSGAKVGVQRTCAAGSVFGRMQANTVVLVGLRSAKSALILRDELQQMVYLAAREEVIDRIDVWAAVH